MLFRSVKKQLIQAELDNANNTSEYALVDLNRKIKSDPELLTIVDGILETCSELTKKKPIFRLKASMIPIHSPIHQSLLIVITTIILGFISNAIRSDSIPFIAEELTVTKEILLEVENIEEPILTGISLSQAKILHDEGILFVDARGVEYWKEGRIKGAIVSDNFMELLFRIDSIQGKEKPIVIYCSDDDCGSSEDLAYDMQLSEFTQLYVFKGGWLSWDEAGYPTESSQ